MFGKMVFMLEVEDTPQLFPMVEGESRVVEMTVCWEEVVGLSSVSGEDVVVIGTSAEGIVAMEVV